MAESNSGAEYQNPQNIMQAKTMPTTTNDPNPLGLAWQITEAATHTDEQQSGTRSKKAHRRRTRTVLDRLHPSKDQVHADIPKG